jgi:hypothetical protein
MIRELVNFLVSKSMMEVREICYYCEVSCTLAGEEYC